MHSSLLFLTLTTSFLALPTYALNRGINVGANNPDGACKTAADWEAVFTSIQSLPNGFNMVRQFASSDCQTLANSVPAAIATNTKLLVGVWATDGAHYEAEKRALSDAITQYGGDWIVAISVGSEDLYRGDNAPDNMANQINDVRGLINSLGVSKWVGHVDTWTAWVAPANAAVIAASDFIGLDGYPYFQGATIEQASDVFWQSVTDTRNAVQNTKPDTPIWVTETGFPVSGPDFGPSHPSVENAQAYWKSVGCAVLQQLDLFWYAYQDYTSSPSFGLVDANRAPIFDLNC